MPRQDYFLSNLFSFLACFFPDCCVRRLKRKWSNISFRVPLKKFTDFVHKSSPWKKAPHHRWWRLGRTASGSTCREEGESHMMAREFGCLVITSESSHDGTRKENAKGRKNEKYIAWVGMTWFGINSFFFWGGGVTALSFDPGILIGERRSTKGKKNGMAKLINLLFPQFAHNHVFVNGGPSEFWNDLQNFHGLWVF